MRIKSENDVSEKDAILKIASFIFILLILYNNIQAERRYKV